MAKFRLTAVMDIEAPTEEQAKATFDVRMWGGNDNGNVGKWTTSVDEIKPRYFVTHIVTTDRWAVNDRASVLYTCTSAHKENAENICKLLNAEEDKINA